MSDLHTNKVMQEGDASAGGWPRLSPRQASLAIFLAFSAFVVIYLVFFPVIVTDGVGRGRETLSNLKQIALSNLMYATDYDARLPLAETWMDALKPYAKNDQIFHDPDIEDRKTVEYGIAFFKPISGINAWTVRQQEEVPLVFQSILMGRNARSDLSTLPAIPRNGKANCVAFIDGHAKAFPPTWPEHPITVVIDPSLAKEPKRE